MVASARSHSRVLVLGLTLLILYAATADYTRHYGVDTFTNAAQARSFAANDGVILEELDGFGSERFQGHIAWFTEAPGGTTSQYPPGTALWAAPFYLANSSYETVQMPREWGLVTTVEDGVEVEGPIVLAYPSVVPASLAAATSVAIAILFLGLTVSRELSERATLGVMLLAGLGTGAWSVAADRLWQHGPAMMFISIGTYFASRDRFAASGFAFAAAVLVRPHTAVIAAGIGIAVALSRRSWKEMTLLGAASATGMVALMFYNFKVFGAFSVSAGYDGELTGNLVGSSLATLGERLVDSVFHDRVGILWTSPFVRLLVPVIW